MGRCLRCKRELIEGEDIFRIEIGSLYCKKCGTECFTDTESRLLCNDMGYVDTVRHIAVIDLDEAREVMEMPEASLDDIAEVLYEASSDSTYWTEFCSDCDDEEEGA